MRMILLAGMMTFAAAAANAESSIDVIKTDNTSRSIDFIRCSACAPLKTKKAAVADVVLKPGTQKVEIRDVAGVRKVYRTEAWLGGSPVTYVSKASIDLGDKQDVAATTDQNSQPIIRGQEATAAVTADMSGAEAKVKLDKLPANADTSNAEPVVKIDKSTTSSTNADMSGNTEPAATPKMVQRFNPQDLQLRLK
jgi:hypothetical protein